jgi:hypothetical protein
MNGNDAEPILARLRRIDEKLDAQGDDIRNMKFDVREIKSRIEIIERKYPIILGTLDRLVALADRDIERIRSIEERLTALERV